MATVINQMRINKRTQVFGEKGTDAGFEKTRPLHWREAFTPIPLEDLNEKETSEVKIRRHC